jgi:predicted small lipoprotein YifL
MFGRLMFAVLVSLSLIACGVKSDLSPPQGSMPDPHQQDSSKPPRPLGQ